MLPPLLTPALSQSALAHIQLVATDMDGTLTTAGDFTPGLLDALKRLTAHGMGVMIVTGRSAGWVSALVNYLPVVGAIAENGGLYIPKDTLEPMILPDTGQIGDHRDRLLTLFNQIKRRYPQLTPSVDNAYRITDWTFDIEGLSAADLDWMQTACAAQSMGFTYSTVQCHLKLESQNKAAGLTTVLQRMFPQIAPTNVVTVGDSPNDESLFDGEQFPHSVGVANVAHYLPALAHSPAYLTSAPEGQGFLELVEQLVMAAQSSSQLLSSTSTP